MRYFIVYYISIRDFGTGHGSLSLSTTGGKYINRIQTVNMIKELSTTPIIDCVISNIIELNETDFDTYRENDL